MAKEATEMKKEVSPVASTEARKVKLTIPLINENDTDVFVAVNGEAYRIPRGEEVEVPYYIAEAYQLSAKADTERIRNAAAKRLQKKAKELDDMR